MKPAAMLFTCSPPQSSSTMLVFFIVYPLLHLSVCLPFPTSSTSLRLLLPYEPTPPSMPTPPLLPTASCPFPHLAWRVPNECQAGIQGVCRRASLTGSAGAAAGRTCCPDSPGSQRQKSMLCWLVGLTPPLSDWSWLPCKGPAPCWEGPVTCCDVWNALIVGFCTPVPSSVILVLSLDPFLHPCLARVLMFNPPLFFTYCIPDAYQSACSASLSSLWLYLILLTLCCAQQDLYGVRNNFHLKQSSPEVSEHVGQKILKAQRNHTEPNIRLYLFLDITSIFWKSGGRIIFKDQTFKCSKHQIFFSLKSICRSFCFVFCCHRDNKFLTSKNELKASPNGFTAETDQRPKHLISCYRTSR